MRRKIAILIAVLLSGFLAYISVSGEILINEGNQIRDSNPSDIGGLTPLDVDISKPFTINFGSNLIVCDANQLRNGLNVSRSFFVDFSLPIQIDLSNETLEVSVTIENDQGQPLANIVNNQWRVFEQTPHWDRNYNSSAFELIGQDNTPVLQVVLIPNNNTVDIMGDFYSQTGRDLVTPNGITCYLLSEQVNKSLSPLFRYPSDEYWGQSAGSNGLSKDQIATNTIKNGYTRLMIGVVGGAVLGTCIAFMAIWKKEKKPRLRNIGDRNLKSTRQQRTD
jgi:hypothetical protein